MKFPAVLLLLLAQAPGAGPQAPVPPAAIEGITLKGESGAALAKATVTLTSIQPLPGRGVTNGVAPPPPLPPPPPAAPAAAVNTAIQQIRLLSDGTITTGGVTASRQSMTTTFDGRFVFENLTAGSYQLSATAPGYVNAEYGQRGPNGRGITFTLKAGERMKDVALALTPEGSIAGRVVDANGEPVSRAIIQAQKVIYQERGRALATVQSVATDDRGEFRLFWLPAGQYYVSATPADDNMRTQTVSAGNANALLLQALNANVILSSSPGAPAPGSVPGVRVVSSTLASGEVIEEAAVKTYYPSATDIAASTPIEVRAGSVTGGVNITAINSRVYHIRGTTVDGGNGMPVAARNLSLLASSGNLVSQAVGIVQTGTSAGFDIAGVAPGSYYLIADAISVSPPSALRAIVPVEVRGANLNDLVIPLSPGASIRGHVVLEGTTPNIPVITPAGPQSQIRLTLNAQTPGLPSPGASTLPDGTLLMSLVMPGDYRAMVTAPGYVPKSILFNGRDVQSEGLHITSSAEGVLDIVMTNKSGRLEGNVTGDRQQRASNVTVVLAPASALRGQTDLYRSVATNADGHYTIENLPPGSYRLFAWNDIPANAWFDADYMRAYESQGRDITIREGEMEMLDLSVIPQ